MNNFKAKRNNGIIWSFQVISGIILAVILVIHFWLLHFAGGGQMPTYKIIAGRLSNPWYKFIDVLFLALVLYHALNGVREILLDFNLKKRTQYSLSIALTIVAVIFFFLGFKVIISVGL